MSVNAVGSVLSSRRFNRLLPWISGLVLLAGLIVFLGVRLSNTASPQGARVGKGPVAVTKKPETIKLEPAARQVAGKFILTAVARKHLAQAWNLITPRMKHDCGCTYREWLKGDINVVPFPAGDIRMAPFKVDWSYKRDAALEIALLSKSGKIKSQIFFIELKKVGEGKSARWLVDYWAPRGGGIMVPATQNG